MVVVQAGGEAIRVLKGMGPDLVMANEQRMFFELVEEVEDHLFLMVMMVASQAASFGALVGVVEQISSGIWQSPRPFLPLPQVHIQSVQSPVQSPCCFQ